jgi:hypothetical protein
LGKGWEVIRSWVWHPHEWDYCPYKRDPRETLAPSPCGIKLGELSADSSSSLGPRSAGILSLDIAASRSRKHTCSSNTVYCYSRPDRQCSSNWLPNAEPFDESV